MSVAHQNAVFFAPFFRHFLQLGVFRGIFFIVAGCCCGDYRSGFRTPSPCGCCPTDCRCLPRNGCLAPRPGGFPSGSAARTASATRARSFPAGCAARTPLAAAGAASAAGPAVADHLAENQRHNDYKNRSDNNCSDVICEPCHDKCLLCLFPLSVAPLFTCLKPPISPAFNGFSGISSFAL